MPKYEALLRLAYDAFNARDIEAAVELMHPEVDWPNAWEGSRVIGKGAIRDYWTRQFTTLSSNVQPEEFTEEAGTTRWYFYDTGRDEILEEPAEIVESIRSSPETRTSPGPGQLPLVPLA